MIAASSPPFPSLTPWRIACAGVLSLAIAMGIGRFAFTPLLPMMLHDGVVDLQGASWLASANYMGYLLGALLCTFQPLIWRRLAALPPVQATFMVRLGLACTCVLTLGMAVQWPTAWALLRGVAGMSSAFVFVYTSGWCLGQLAQRGVPAMGALIYTGPGIGIVLSGLAASGMVAFDWRASAGWLAFGLLATALTAVVWPAFSRHNALALASAAAASSGNGANTSAPDASRRVPHQPHHGGTETALLALAYGFAGFGYIVTATFLPVIARQSLPGSPLLDMFWPLFGVGVICGAWLASRVRKPSDLRGMLACCYVVQALGIGISLLSPSLAGFAIGSLLLGLPFTAITFFAMQEVRRIKPVAASAYMGLLTATYGLGQIAGPPMTAALLARASSAAQGFNLALEIAAGSLVLGALVYGALIRMYPARHA